MPITYGDANNPARVVRWNSTTNVYSSLGSSGAFDILDGMIVGDAFLFQFFRSRGGKSIGLNFNVGTPVIGTFTGVWEYAIRNAGGTTTGIGWLPFSNVVDNTNNFSIAGVNTVTWDIADQWENFMNPNGQTVWYTFSIRYRITSLSGITELGRMSSTTNMGQELRVTGQDWTMQDLYDDDLANNRGLVTKQGQGVYTLNASVRCDSGASFTFTTFDETITFLNGMHIYIRCLANYGLLTASGKPYRGSVFRFEGVNHDYSSCFLIWNNANVFDTTIRFVRSDLNQFSHQGMWGGGFGTDNGQTILQNTLYKFRNYGFTRIGNVIKGVVYEGAHTEPAGATMIDCTHYNSTYAVRPNNTIPTAALGLDGQWVHRLDSSDVLTAEINPWRVSVANWTFNHVDGIHSTSRPFVQWRTPSAPLTNFLTARALKWGSLEANVTNSSNIPIDNVMVSVFDNSGLLVNSLATNLDGFIAEDMDVQSVTSNSTLTLTNMLMPGKHSREMLITSGNAAGERKVISQATTTTLTMDSVTVNDVVALDRFIQIPYIKVSTTIPPANSGVETSIIGADTDHFPFILSFRKYGYISFVGKNNFTSQVKSSFLMSINNNVSASEASAGLISGITIDGLLNTITISSSVTSQDLYDYSQWWHTQDSNLIFDEPIKTADGINYILTSGWVLFLDLQISGGINISGNVTISNVFDIASHNIEGQLTFSTAGTYNISNSIVGSVSNSSGGNILININNSTINTNSGPSITIDSSVNLTLQNILPGSEVRIYDDEVANDNNFNTELAGIESNPGTVFSYSHNGSSNNVIIQVMLFGFVELRIDFDLDNLDQIVIISQKADTNV